MNQILCFFLLIIFSECLADSIELYGRHKQYYGYIDMQNMKIYSANEQYVGFLYIGATREQKQTIHVYNPDGVHLGWIASGALWDHAGRVVATLKTAQQKKAVFIPVKQIILPICEPAPEKPRFLSKWSQLTLWDFFSEEYERAQKKYGWRFISE